MDYNTLLDLVADLGYRLAMNGAETFRVEESAHLIMKSYGIESEVYAIPSCLIVSIETAEGKPMTRMRRIGDHGNNLDSVEKFSNLSRRICIEHPDPETAYQWLKQVDSNQISYSNLIVLMGHFLSAAGFAVLFGSNFLDSLWAGLCGFIAGIVTVVMSRLKSNQFFRIIISAFIMSTFAYILSGFNLIANADIVIIGGLMLLVPGLLFTNAMRDIIYGDTNSGMNRIVQVILIAFAIALGTAAGWIISESLFGAHNPQPALIHSFPIQLLGAFVACVGFSFVFNVHGPGLLLCAAGSVLAWAVYLVMVELGSTDVLAVFFAAAVASLYAEIMARIRKYPAISYLVIAILPFIPGSSIYYTMTHALRGDMASFTNVGFHTAAITGAIAVGILLVSTIFRIWSSFRKSRK